LKRLPVIATVKEAILVVWQRRIDLFRALLATALVLAALDVAKSHLTKGFGLLVSLLGLFVFTLFAVTCHRIVLLGETSVPTYGVHSWTSRETRFVGWSLVMAFYVLLVILPIGLIGGGIALYFDAKGYEVSVTGYEKYAFGLAASIPAVYVFARLAVLLPATAVGERHNTDWAFDTTANNGWRLAAMVVVIPALLGHATNALRVENSPLMDFLVRLVSYAFIAVGIAALSLSFRFLASTPPEENGANRALQRTAEGGR
jgi:hypothetical protein